LSVVTESLDVATHILCRKLSEIEGSRTEALTQEASDSPQIVYASRNSQAAHLAQVVRKLYQLGLDNPLRPWGGRINPTSISKRIEQALDCVANCPAAVSAHRARATASGQVPREEVIDQRFINISDTTLPMSDPV
jgi:hypothetical protein